MRLSVHPTRIRTSLLFLRSGLIALLLICCAWSAAAQDFGTTTGLLQGERIARVTRLLDDTLRAESDTTAWLRFGTSSADLAGERVYAPTRFTLFAKVDTSGIAHAATPTITLQAQVALEDTSVIYENFDGSLLLASASTPLTETIGAILPVPIYGGGYLRFIVASEDSARVRLHLWRVR